jgi:hypothetical protein
MAVLAFVSLAIVFLLWCLAHLALENLQRKSQMVDAAQIGTKPRTTEIAPFRGTNPLNSKKYKMRKAG